MHKFTDVEFSATKLEFMFIQRCIASVLYITQIYNVIKKYSQMCSGNQVCIYAPRRKLDLCIRDSWPSKHGEIPFFLIVDFKGIMPH